MCGRYTITADPTQLAERFNAALPSELIQPRFNVAPTQSLPVLLNEGEREIQLLRWGLIPRWAKEPSNDYSMINARAETLEEKNTYRDAFRKRRCLVLADSFYEWQKTPDVKTKVPMRIMLKSGQPFAFAGLWETWKDHETGELIRSFTIVTTTPNDLVEPIHNRMPAILLPELENEWINDDTGPDVWRDLLKPYPADLMTAYPVSRRVNSPANDDPSLLQPA
ncbi:MAG: SOS response-associated peptidase [Anaerolineae bacterium]|nr:SOS response-associated peptidase [Anaerolineae bacterium]